MLPTDRERDMTKRGGLPTARLQTQKKCAWVPVATSVCARRGDRAVVSWQRPWVPPLRLAEQRADQVVRLAPMHWPTLPV